MSAGNLAVHPTGASRCEKPCKRWASGPEDQVSALFESLRAEACVCGSRRLSNDDPCVRRQVFGRVHEGGARLDERMGELPAPTPASGISNGHKPARDTHSRGLRDRCLAALIDERERAFQPRSTSRPSASQ